MLEENDAELICGTDTGHRDVAATLHNRPAELQHCLQVPGSRNHAALP